MSFYVVPSKGLCLFDWADNRRTEIPSNLGRSKNYWNSKWSATHVVQIWRQGRFIPFACNAVFGTGQAALLSVCFSSCIHKSVSPSICTGTGIMKSLLNPARIRPHHSMVEGFMSCALMNVLNQANQANVFLACQKFLSQQSEQCCGTGVDGSHTA